MDFYTNQKKMGSGLAYWLIGLLEKLSISGSDPGKVLFLQTMLPEIWVEKVLGCAFWG